MTEEEFRALLKLEGKELVVERDMYRGPRYNHYKPVPYYSAYVLNSGEDIEVQCNSKPYRSRTYAIQQAIKKYYEDN